MTSFLGLHFHLWIVLCAIIATGSLSKRVTNDEIEYEIRTLNNHKATFEFNKYNKPGITFYPTPYKLLKKVKVPQFNIELFNQSKKLDSILTQSGCHDWESLYDFGDRIIEDNAEVNSFITSAVNAWSYHLPLRIKPQHIWLLILQALATHINDGNNAEILRYNFVNHTGKVDLKVRRDGFVLGSKCNDWRGVIDEFIVKMNNYTNPDITDLLSNEFSSSTIDEIIAGEVAIMDIMQAYFQYNVYTTCGFTEVSLHGSKQDWTLLKEKAVELLSSKVEPNFGENWSNSLIPILDEFINVWDGNIDSLFWNSMIKRGATTGSGARTWLNGWFNILFPFDKSNKPNRYCEPYSNDAEYITEYGLSNQESYESYPSYPRSVNGFDYDEYPIGINSAPVTWYYYSQEIPLKFISGFIGYTQDTESKELCPKVGWIIGK